MYPRLEGYDQLINQSLAIIIFDRQEIVIGSVLVKNVGGFHVSALHAHTRTHTRTHAHTHTHYIGCQTCKTVNIRYVHHSRTSLSLPHSLSLYFSLSSLALSLSPVHFDRFAGRRRRETWNFIGGAAIEKQLKDKPARRRVGFVSSGPVARGMTRQRHVNPIDLSGVLFVDQYENVVQVVSQYNDPGCNTDLDIMSPYIT